MGNVSEPFMGGDPPTFSVTVDTDPTDHYGENQQVHEDGIEHICDALMASGLWHEIDGDGTEYSIIADHIRRLVRERAEALRQLGFAHLYLSPACPEVIRKGIAAYLADQVTEEADHG